MIELLHGDSLTVLRSLPSESVHCVVTSPPYWGLRDYGVSGQIGLEASLGEHIDTLVTVFREVRRVLRKDGTLWLNYGDAYASAPNGRSAADTKAIGNDDRTFRDKPISTVGPVYDPLGGAKGGGFRGDNLTRTATDNNVPKDRVVAGGTLKPKDRMLLPARVAIALQEDGWWIRDEIIWHKPNPMPSSVKDRTTPAHEMIYLLSKSPRYYYDADAIRLPASAALLAQVEQGYGGADTKDYATHGAQSPSGTKARIIESARRKLKIPGAWATNSGAHGSINKAGRTSAAYQEAVAKLGANRRSVWSVTPKPFPQAHFATFPPDLIRPCIMAGSPEQCCAHCGAPWKRVVSRRFVPQNDVSAERGVRGADGQKPMDASNSWEGFPRGSTETETLGFEQDCACAFGETTPGVVLDPFMGAGTTALVARGLGRRSIGIELNATYLTIARDRLGLNLGAFA